MRMTSRTIPQTVLVSAAWLLLAAPAAFPADHGHFTSRRTCATPAEFDDCFRDGGIAVGGPAGPVSLAESELLLDHVGNRLAGKPKFSAAIHGRKLCHPDGQPARAAGLYVCGGCDGSFNGRPLPAARRMQTDGWAEFTIDAWLKTGGNEVVFPGGSVAMDADAAPARSSFTSRDGGGTWEPDAGEFPASLRLERFVAGGVITSDVIDGADDGTAVIRTRADIATLAVTCTSRTSDRAGDVDWTVTTIGMTLTATGKPGEVTVTLDTVAPNFKAFVYRFDDGPWRTMGGDGTDLDERTGTLNDGSLAGDASRYRWSAARPGGQLFRYDPLTGTCSPFLNLPGGRCTATSLMDRTRNIWWCNLERRIDGKGPDAVCAIDLATRKVLQAPGGSAMYANLYGHPAESTGIRTKQQGFGLTSFAVIHIPPSER